LRHGSVIGSFAALHCAEDGVDDDFQPGAILPTPPELLKPGESRGRLPSRGQTVHDGGERRKIDAQQRVVNPVGLFHFRDRVHVGIEIPGSPNCRGSAALRSSEQVPMIDKIGLNRSRLVFHKQRLAVVGVTAKHIQHPRRPEVPPIFDPGKRSSR